MIDDTRYERQLPRQYRRRSRPHGAILGALRTPGCLLPLAQLQRPVRFHHFLKVPRGSFVIVLMPTTRRSVMPLSRTAMSASTSPWYVNTYMPMSINRPSRLPQQRLEALEVRRQAVCARKHEHVEHGPDAFLRWCLWYGCVLRRKIGNEGTEGECAPCSHIEVRCQLQLEGSLGICMMVTWDACIQTASEASKAESGGVMVE